MKRRYLYLLLVFFSAYLSSLMLQTSMYQPLAAKQAASDFREVEAGFCVAHAIGGRWSIKIHSGEMPKDSVGLLTAPKTQLQPGDCLTSRMQLSPIEGFNRFAFKATLKEVQSEIVHQTSLSAVNAMRKYASGFRGDARNLVAGLAIGIDSGLSKQFLVNMRTTGLTHLTAVSGANCAIVLGVFWLLAKLLRFGRNLRFASSVLALCGYVSLVGPQPSVLRAAFMMTVVLAALEFGRRVWVPGALGLGSAILLVLDPWLVADYGFWLSFLATLGLVLLTPTLNQKFQQYFPKPVAIGLAATIAAQIWCLPLLAQLQGGFTTYSVLANLLVEPMVPVITVLGLFSTLAGPLIPWLGEGLLILASFSSSWIVFVANSLAQAPANLLEIPTGFLGTIAIASFVICISIALIRKSFMAMVASVAFLLLWLATSIGNFLPKLNWPIDNWQVVACDVGQGDGLVVRSANETAVIDAGKDPELIDHCLDRLGVTQIDLLVLTHFDNDHVGGLSGVQRGRAINLALVSKFPDERSEAKALLDELELSARHVTPADLGLSGSLGDFTWSVISSLGETADSANQGSLALRFEDSKMVIYTLADLDEEAQVRSLSYVSPSPKFTIVKVSHHGSADQSEEFYQLIKPDLALISVGQKNSYGHPTNRILQVLETLKSEVFRTDTQGAISLAMNNGIMTAYVAGAR